MKLICALLFLSLISNSLQSPPACTPTSLTSGTYYNTGVDANRVRQFFYSTRNGYISSATFYAYSAAGGLTGYCSIVRATDSHLMGTSTNTFTTTDTIASYTATFSPISVQSGVGYYLYCYADNDDTIAWGFTNGNTFTDATGQFTTDAGESWQSYGNNLAFTIPITCTGGGGDPHFFGFRGQKFDIHGTSGHIYNIISTPSFQMNSQFLNYALLKTSDATWFTTVGIKSGNDKFLLDPTNKIVQLNDLPIAVGKAIEVNEFTRVKRDSKDHLVIETQDFELDITLTFTGHANCVDKYCPHIDFGVSLKDNKNVLAHGDHDFEHNENSEINKDKISTVQMHGLLGQTIYDREFLYKPDNFKYMEGEVEDYRVSDVFADDFVYNQYVQ